MHFPPGGPVATPRLNGLMGLQSFGGIVPGAETLMGDSNSIPTARFAEEEGNRAIIWEANSGGFG